MNKLIPLLMLLVSMPSLAQREFDIEVIIFKRSVNPEQTSEAWPNTLPEIDLSRAGSLGDADFREQKQVELLPDSALELTSQAADLRRHAGFSVLLHTAWRQDDRGRASAPTFRLRAGEDYSDSFLPDGSVYSDELVSEPVDDFVESNAADPLYELDGTLQVYVQHYLFADAVFDLKRPSVREVVIENTQFEDPIEEEETAAVVAGHMQEIEYTTEVEKFLKSYRLDQKRRMRSGEIHYFDHPLMGMIIQVRRAPQDDES
ncbi:peptidoglycan binding protein CsiV [Vibrio sp. WXL210]|uniref:peptidoglycan binding protein CsiV n=1 Tax=Vibrio sp. WXL210 TaxID=3450709 RepID=UPI003EC595BB